MAASDIDANFTLQGRLSSFRKAVKKKGSTASGPGTKASGWPHKDIAPESLAKAGFFFSPGPGSSDNVTCFLCGKDLDGWGAGDDPLLEHLQHVPDCGWAIVAAIEANIGDYGRQDPSGVQMIRARRATFASQWPHEGKRGWKCKTKQLADAGWKYTPTAESDDMATCTYCQLAVDDWEPSDKPHDEHHKRSPSCAFFVLSSQYGASRKKGSGRAASKRGSKASRLSTQSSSTIASEVLPPFQPFSEPDDSDQTATSMTQSKSQPKRKRAAVAKNGRGKARPKATDDDSELSDQQSIEETSNRPIKTSRGRKRSSDAVDDSLLTTQEAPVRKKRATQARGSTVTNNTPIVIPLLHENSIDASLLGVNGFPPPDRKLAPRSRVVSTVSTASLASLRGPIIDFPSDDEIERQLEADLARNWSQDEDEQEEEQEGEQEGEQEEEYGKEEEEPQIKQDEEEQDHKMPTEKAHRQQSDYAMFNPTSYEPGDASLEEELRELQADMANDSRQAKPQAVEKHSKNDSLKVSKSTGSRASPTEQPVGDAQSIKPISRPPSTERASRRSRRSFDKDEGATKMAQSRRSHDQNERKRDASAPSASSPKEAGTKPSEETEGGSQAEEIEAKTKRARKAPSAETNHQRQVKSDEDVSNAQKGNDLPHATEESDELSLDEKNLPSRIASIPPPKLVTKKVTITSPAPTVTQPPASPIQSPQSSNAENQPAPRLSNVSPSPRGGPLIQTAATPRPRSPTKRNMLPALESADPWHAVDLNDILGDLTTGASQHAAMEELLKRGGELTSPEAKMTVEEWIYFNAGEAEKILKHECEAMVSRFEQEGTRAMNVLQGLAVE